MLQSLWTPAQGRAQAHAFLDRAEGPRRWPLVRCFWLYRLTPWGFVLTSLLYVALNTALALQQWQLGRVIQSLHTGAGARLLMPALVLLVGYALARALLQYAAAMSGLLIQQQLLTTLREAILRQVQSLSLGEHRLRGAGQLISRTTHDADKVRDSLTSFWRQGVDSALVMVTAIGFLAWYHPLLASVPLLLVIAAVVLLVRQADALCAMDHDLGQAYDGMNQELSEGVHGVRVIKAFTLEADRMRRFTLRVSRLLAVGERALRFAARHVAWPQWLVAAGQVWVLGAGARLVQQGRLNLGELAAALLMVNLLVFRFEAVGRVVRIYADARSSAARIWEFLDQRSALQGGQATPPQAPWRLRVQGVAVRWPGQQQALLEGLSFEIEPGEIVAITGVSGAGKSTLASLLPRLADPSQGSLSVAALQGPWVDLRELPLEALRQQLQVVAQDNFLFSDTVAENLRLAAPGASPEDLLTALRDADAEDFVLDLPEGLETRIGDRGTTLSGGQRQRLCLARALLARPALLVLDESTSALDTVTEARILSGLRRRSAAAAPHTAPAILLIASRRSSLALADRVLFLDDARIVAQGRHVDLARQLPAYRRLTGEVDGIA